MSLFLNSILALKNLRIFLFFVLVIGSVSVNTQAAVELESLGSEALDSRYRGLVAELRCVVCQNQSLAESNVELAQDLRAQVRTQLTAGASNREIKDYLVARYGEFVLYEPRLSPKTLFLWLIPPLIIIFGFIAIVRSRRSAASIDPLSAEEQQRLNDLLSSNQTEKPTSVRSNEQ